MIYCWLPSYIGIRGNERADSSAKAGLGKEISAVKLPYQDVRQYIGKYVTGIWQMNWDQEVNNTVHSIKPKLGDGPLHIEKLEEMKYFYVDYVLVTLG